MNEKRDRTDGIEFFSLTSSNKKVKILENSDSTRYKSRRRGIKCQE